MAGEQEQNQQQNKNPEQVPGNSAEARNPDGSLKDQNSTPPSGQNPTNGEQNQQGNDDARSFLNRKSPAAEDANKKPDAPVDDKQLEKAEDKTPAGAPEKYEDFKLPEGYTFDPEALKEVSGMFKKHNLSQAAAQELVDYYANNSLKAAQAPYELWATTQKEWVGEIENRFGSKAEGMRTSINQAIDAALDAPKLNRAFREALDLTGAGSNPDFFEALSIFAKPFLEGTPVPAGGQSKEANQNPGRREAPSIADAMYPHLVKNRTQ